MNRMIRIHVITLKDFLDYSELSEETDSFGVLSLDGSKALLSSLSWNNWRPRDGGDHGVLHWAEHNA